MLAYLIVVTVGLAIGLARGGSMSNLANARLALVWLVFVSFGLQVAAQFVPPSASMISYGLVIVSYATLFPFAGANWRVPGMAFIAIGALMNYVVILANQGMPISAEAAARVGFSGEEAARLVVRGKHFIVHGGDANLSFLGDIIPLWRQPTVASAGDVVVWAGLVLLIAHLVRGPRGRRATVDPRDGYEHLPAGHVKANAGDAMLAEIDLRDTGVVVIPEETSVVSTDPTGAERTEP